MNLASSVGAKHQRWAVFGGEMTLNTRSLEHSVMKKTPCLSSVSVSCPHSEALAFKG